MAAGEADVGAGYFIADVLDVGVFIFLRFLLALLLQYGGGPEFLLGFLLVVLLLEATLLVFAVYGCLASGLFQGFAVFG